MRLRLHQVSHGACPYLPDRTWVTEGFELASVPGGVYEEMLADGWRRSGHSFYRNRCSGCRLCIPVRVPVTAFRASRSQRRAMRRNAGVSVEISRTGYASDVIELYRRYVAARHDHREEFTAGHYMSFLGSSPVDTLIMRYRAGDTLVGVGWIDVLAKGLSSVYFAFEPAEARRSLGVYSVIHEIRLAAALGLDWLYLGFYVPGSPKMEYKGSFRPREFALDGRWTADEEEVFRTLATDACP